MNKHLVTWLLTGVCLICAAMPFVVPRIPVSSDMLEHLYVARVISEYSNPVYGYNSAYDLILQPRSTVLGELVLAGLIKVFQPFKAASAYYALFVVTLWLASCCLASSINAPKLMALWVLPLAHTFFVFFGLLPFIGSLALFPLVPALAVRQPRVRARLELSFLLLVIYGFHVLGAFAACTTTLILALTLNSTWRERIADAMATLPTAALGLYFVAGGGAHGKWLYPASPAGKLKAFFAYNIWTLSRISSIALLLLIIILGGLIVRQRLRRRVAAGFLAGAVVLTVVGIALPVQIGGEFIVGSRMLPFAIILAIAALAKGLSYKQWLGGSVAAALFLCLSGLLNTAAALRTQPLYREFLSGMEVVDFRSHILSVISDQALGGNQFIPAFFAVDAIYSIFRGGSNPDAFAESATGKGVGIQNGAMLLRFKSPQTYAYVFSTVPTDFTGVSRDYDAVLIFGTTGPAALAKSAASAEMRLAYSNGRLAIYKRP